MAPSSSADAYAAVGKASKALEHATSSAQRADATKALVKACRAVALDANAPEHARADANKRMWRSGFYAPIHRLRARARSRADASASLVAHLGRAHAFYASLLDALTAQLDEEALDRLEPRLRPMLRFVGGAARARFGLCVEQVSEDVTPFDLQVHLCEWRKFRTRVDRMRLCRRGSVLDRVRALRDSRP